MKMTKRQKEAYSYFYESYQLLKDLNQPYRDKFDTYDEFYRGYREDSDYPFAYNYSYHKIIPIIYTVLSRVMGHLYQNTDIAVVKPRHAQDIERADVISGVLNYQLNNMNNVDFQGGSYMVFFQWFLSALIHGKGIVKAYWRKEERSMPRRKEIPIPKIENGQVVGTDFYEVWVEEPTSVYDAPYIENLPVRQFMPDPEYRSIQEMPVVAHVYKKSMNWLKKMAEIGTFNKNANNVGKLSSDYHRSKSQARSGHGTSIEWEEFQGVFRDIEDAFTIEEIENDRHKGNNIDIIDCYGKYKLGEGKTVVGEGLTFAAPEEEVVCTIANYETAVRLEPVQYGMKPFFDVGAHINPHRYWDIGMLELVKDVLEMYDNIANLRAHNSMMQVNTMIKVMSDSDIDPRSLVWKPFGIIPVESMNDIELLSPPDYTGHTFNEQIQFFESVIQDVTGIYDYAKGVTPSRQEHVGTISSLQQVAENRIKLLILTMDYMGIRPLLKYMMMLNTHHLPSGFEFRITDAVEGEQFKKVWGSDLHVDYDFEARYAALEPALTKENRIATLMQYSQMWAQDPSVNQYEFKKAVLEMMDMVNPEKFLKDPKVVQQEMQQQQQAALAPQKQQMEMQSQQSKEKNIVEMAKALVK